MTKHDLEVGEFLRLGGRRIPSKLAAKSRAAVKAAVKSMLLKKRDAEIEQRIQRAKLRGGSPIMVDDRLNRETLGGLRLHNAVASTKVQFPEVARVNGGVWVLSGTVVPPFDIAYTMALPFALVSGKLGDPTMSATANQDGQISASVGTGISDGLNAGREHAIVGFYFRPPGSGTLRAWANPTYSFTWKISSINNETVFDAGSISLRICGVNADGEAVAVEDYQNIYTENGSGDHQESGAQKSLSTSLQVTASLLCRCEVYLDVGAFAFWPDSLAWSMMSATVPSINYEFVKELATL